MKQRSSKRRYLEDHRYSVFTDDMEKCYFCSRPAIEKHEILYGSNRWNSIKNGYVLPVCRDHHNSFHKNRELTRLWAAKCQTYHEELYGVNDWIRTFHRNYRD